MPTSGESVTVLPHGPPPDVIPGGAARQLLGQDGARTRRDMPVGERRPRATGDDRHLEAAVHEQRSDDLPECGIR